MTITPSRPPWVWVAVDGGEMLRADLIMSVIGRNGRVTVTVAAPVGDQQRIELVERHFASRPGGVPEASDLAVNLLAAIGQCQAAGQSGLVSWIGEGDTVTFSEWGLTD